MHDLAAYFKEREGFDSVVREGMGFASYLITEKECYIRDIWVNRDFRKSHVASDIAFEIEEIARAAGCKVLTGSVLTTAKNPTDSVKVLLAYGFEISGAVQNGIFFRKEL